MDCIQKIPLESLEMKGLPEVTILIPAFNEEVGIRKTVMSAMNQVGVSVKVIVINDGSTDRTQQILDELSIQHPNLQLIHKANTGKADSLNVGLSYVSTRTYFTTDGDTILHRMAIARLYKHLENDKVGSVGGQLIVGNNHWKVLTALQSLEYSGLSISSYMGIAGKGFVTPGAIGGYQTDAVQSVGGYSITNGEDMDLSAKLTIARYELKTSFTAKCYTDAPETLMELLKQRLRWNQSAIEALSNRENMRFTLLYLVNYVLPAITLVSKFSENHLDNQLFFISLIILFTGYLTSHLNKNIDDYKAFLALPLLPIYQAALTATFGVSIALYFLKVDIPWHKLKRNGLKARS